MRLRHLLWILAALALAVGTVLLLSYESSQLPPAADTGSQPTLPTPRRTLLPTVLIAPASQWGADETPVAAEGLRVRAFAGGLDHPRWLHVLPNGDVLVAESNAPPRPLDEQGVQGLAAKLVMKRAGAGVPSANRISLLRDADGDGVAELRTAFLENLNSPFGMQLVGDALYVANTDAVLRFDYVAGATSITTPPVTVAALPAGPRNHHWTKNLIASADGRTLYVTVGSNSNVAEHGMDQEENRAAILAIDAQTGATRLYASGLRNPNGLAWQPDTGALWTVVNERDELGSDLVPDYLTEVVDGGFYGWPWSYFGQHVDARVQPPRPDLVATARVPDYALGAHVAALGLAFAPDARLGPAWSNGAFIGLHGSWNRRPRAGYKVVFVPFSAGKPSGPMQDVLDGFVDEDGKARGRPVGVAFDRRDGLLVADDVGNIVWRVTRAP